MSSIIPTPVDAIRPAAISQLSKPQIDRGYGSAPNPPHPYATTGGIGQDTSGANPGNQNDLSPLSQAASYQAYGKFNEEWDASQRGSSILESHTMNHNAPSIMSQGDGVFPHRANTLKKKASLRKSGSRRSSRAGSVRSLALQPEASDEMHSAFYSPVSTTGNPTEILANRFQAWRKLLKDLILYFRELQNSYDHRGKSLVKISNLVNNTSTTNVFLPSNGINDAMQILREYHKQSILEANKAKLIEEDVIQALTGLRSDLQQKIKEIKNLSGDFKNSVDKEMDATRKAVQTLGDALGQSDIDPSQQTGRQDPYILKLAVDRQLERQIDEENYLHQAYLNLEASGRELEAIVVGEIQKAYHAYTGILKREADEAYNTIENLRTGPIAMPKDHEWNSFIEGDEHFVDPRVPIRQSQNIHYPGRDHELAMEVRAGLLERKSKYLKSYTAGWYVLSPTHLHEFKTADKSQAPIMSLYLPEQKLGSHSQEGSSSNKFMLKGRQTGALHRGHSWVFRAESFDTMMAWYEDIKALTDNSPQERNAFVRTHARSFSGTSIKAGSVSSDGVDEEDEEPFSTNSAVVQAQKQDVHRRPEPGGRFPSDIQVDPARGLQVPLSPSSASSGIGETEDRDIIAAAADLPGSGVGEHYPDQHLERRTSSYGHRQAGDAERGRQLHQYAEEDGLNPYTYEPIPTQDQLPSRTLSTADRPAFSVAVAEAHRDQQASTAPEVVATYSLEEQAARESSRVAAADIDQPAYNERLAADTNLAQHPSQTSTSGTQSHDDVSILSTSAANSTPATLLSPETKNIGTAATDFANPANGIVGAQVPAVEKASEMTHTDKMPVPTPTVQKRRSFIESLVGDRPHDPSGHNHIPGEFPEVTPSSETTTFHV